MTKKAVVLLSGGMDSTVTLAIALSKKYKIAALHLNYKQKTEQRELKAFNDITKHYGISEKLIIDVSFFKQIGGSSLTDDKINITKATLNTNEIPTSYVPFRNGNILSIATSWAEIINANAIFIGAMQLDSSGYPDCRQNFFKAFQKAINLGTKPQTNIKIITPIINFTKKDIVITGTKLNVPFELTWSCYQNSKIACGICDSCALRLRGFQQANIKDPIPYETTPNYL